MLKYNAYTCNIYFDATIKFTSELKIKQVKVIIHDIELRASKSDKNNKEEIVNITNITKNFILIYNSFKQFMSELKTLISDLDFLNCY